MCRAIFDRVDDGATVDFVHDVCAQLPSQVVGELVGIPRDDWPKIHAWSEQNSGGQDPDIAASSGDDAMSATIEMAMYAIELAGRRRAEPADDLMSYMLTCEVDGHPMSDIEFGSFFVQLVTAGNDTTRTMLSSGLLALAPAPRATGRAAIRPDVDPIGGRGDPAVGEPAALLPPDRVGSGRARRTVDRPG